MSFEVTILGCSSATPTPDRHPSAQVLSIRNTWMLIDCGESTQNQMLRYKISHHKIRHIFISHLHGDHYLGLNGLLATINFQGRESALHLYGPAALEEMVYLYFKNSGTTLRFPLVFHCMNYEQKTMIVDEPHFRVYSIPLQHRIPTTGFLFEEKRELRHINIEACQSYDIPYASYQSLKEGKAYMTPSGEIIANEVLTNGPSLPRSYAYFSDTRFVPELALDIRAVNLLYHEATFMHDLVDRAEETLHSTARQAAQMAAMASAKRLLLGHFSARYRDLTPLLQEAQAYFQESYLAIEGEKFIVE